MGKKASYSPAMSDLDAGRRGPWVAPCPPPPQETWVAWLVPLIALANIVSFGYTMYVNDCPSTHRLEASDCVFPSLGRFAFEPFSINPLLGPSLYTLDSLGALDYNKVVVEGERWRLLACIWLHAGVIHLLANMLSLLFTGVRLEQEFGFVKIGLLYVLSGIGGSLMSCFSIQSNISVGASGALFGLLGAMLSELITNWTIYSNKCAALLTLMVVIAINLVVGVVPHVDSSAHIGGFVSGFLLGFVLLMRPQFGWISRRHIPPGYNMELIRPKHNLCQYLLWFTALVVLIIGFLFGLIKLSYVDRQLH
ncbi:unnamed protein product [Musa acuminata subsp. malaccensis]|uniref:RHOMBOID-like protein n=2 Tax=Musa acuminata subsp. malaccensis TaxID=214687 RepID=A0A804I161_MUSAM|nr:unnamed protein product [Musa acuminata subsp. malaccensis]